MYIHCTYIQRACTFRAHFSIALHDTSLFEVVNSDNAIFFPTVRKQLVPSQHHPCFCSITFKSRMKAVADLEILGGGIYARAKNLKPHPLFTWPRPSLGRSRRFCVSAEVRRRFSIINRMLIAASRDKKPDYEVRGDPTSPRCALHSTILLYY